MILKHHSSFAENSLCANLCLSVKFQRLQLFFNLFFQFGRSREEFVQIRRKSRHFLRKFVGRNIHIINLYFKILKRSSEKYSQIRPHFFKRPTSMPAIFSGSAVRQYGVRLSVLFPVCVRRQIFRIRCGLFRLPAFC